MLPARGPPTEMRGAARKRPLPPVQGAKAAPAPPKGKGGELWKSLLETAKSLQHPDPEKFADSALRAREKTLEIKANTHKTLKTNKKPKFSEACAAAGKKV